MSDTLYMPKEVDYGDPQLHPSEAFRSKVDSVNPNRSYSQNNLHAYYAHLANSPQYSGQYVNGCFQTTDPAQQDFLLEHPSWKPPDASIAAEPDERPRPLDEWQGTGLPRLTARDLNRPLFRDAQKFQVWNGQDYQVSDRSAPNYLSLKDFAKVDALKYFDSDSWQAVDPNRPFYIPEATLKRYNDLVHSHKEAVGVQQFNAREAILAVQERKALPWWKKIFRGGDDDQSSSDKRRPLNPRLVVAAAVVLLVILLIAFVVALLKCKNGGHQQFSSQPDQGLWGYDWTASGRPR